MPIDATQSTAQDGWPMLTWTWPGEEDGAGLSAVVVTPKRVYLYKNAPSYDDIWALFLEVSSGNLAARLAAGDRIRRDWSWVQIDDIREIRWDPDKAAMSVTSSGPTLKMSFGSPDDTRSFGVQLTSALGIRQVTSAEINTRRSAIRHGAKAVLAFAVAVVLLWLDGRSTPDHESTGLFASAEQFVNDRFVALDRGVVLFLAATIAVIGLVSAIRGLATGPTVYSARIHRGGAAAQPTG